jgi:hypothetical protein
MNSGTSLGLLAGRSPPAIGKASSSVTPSGMVACLEHLWRLLLPAIFSILPEKYRRIIHLASGTSTLGPIV